mmetsp:Transcript_20671/g.58446  ORF Transcript_20671/g.58446 Transcript_20671/m.58446 type:complete len:239 (-) Transcript_20671:190-906(-)
MRRRRGGVGRSAPGRTGTSCTRTRSCSACTGRGLRCPRTSSTTSLQPTRSCCRCRRWRRTAPIPRIGSGRPPTTQCQLKPAPSGAPASCMPSRRRCAAAPRAGCVWRPRRGRRCSSAPPRTGWWRSGVCGTPVAARSPAVGSVGRRSSSSTARSRSAGRAPAGGRPSTRALAKPRAATGRAAPDARHRRPARRSAREHRSGVWRGLPELEFTASAGSDPAASDAERVGAHSAGRRPPP